MTMPSGAVRVGDILKRLFNHHLEHELGGTDPVRYTQHAQTITMMMKNNSGGQVSRGTWIKLDESGTVVRAFTTTATPDDHRLGGCTVEDIAAGSFGMVAIGGYVAFARVASGATIYQFLSPSTTAGVMQGTSEPTPGTCGIQLSDRDSGSGTAEVLIFHMHGASTVYDSISSASVQQSFWDDFTGRLSTISSSERYEMGNVGATDPSFQRDSATAGLTYLLLPSVNAVGDSVFVRFDNATFTPRAAEDWGFKCIISEGSAPNIGTGKLQYMIGFIEAITTANSDGIFFRSNESGNWFLVCRNAATETTRDLGVATNTTKHLLEFRITGDGASVQAYVDGIATGAAITTNIPTNLLDCGVTVICHTGNITAAGEVWLWGWGLQSGF